MNILLFEWNFAFIFHLSTLEHHYRIWGAIIEGANDEENKHSKGLGKHPSLCNQTATPLDRKSFLRVNISEVFDKRQLKPGILLQIIPVTGLGGYSHERQIPREGGWAKFISTITASMTSSAQLPLRLARQSQAITLIESRR